ncbi:MAG TPA: AAA family ATPase [Chloroflexota bacterium]|nr:AAA family ATPase [Chloroflexota bacterium]
MTEAIVMVRGALRSLPFHSNNGHLANPLIWLAGYCGVEYDLLACLPISADGDQVSFDFTGLAVRKLRVAATKDIRWAPAKAFCPPLWPLPADNLPETIWALEGETDCIIGRAIGLNAFALTKGAETTLSHAQATALKQHGVQRVAICLDADNVGKKGTGKLTKVLTEAGLEVGTIDLAAAGLVDPLLGQKDLRDAWLACCDRAALRSRLETNLTWHYKTMPCQVRLREVDATELEPLTDGESIPSLPLLGIEGYIMEGWSHILAGYPKAGKTELTFDSVKQWVVDGKTVLWLTEESQAVWQQRVGRHTDMVKGLRLYFAMGAEPGELLERARSGDEDVVIVDTIRNLLRITDENDNSAISKALGAWESALRAKTRIYIHHERKMGGEHGQAIAGGGAFLGIVDRAIELRFDENDKKRRQLVVHSRIADAPDLVYTLTGSGFTALGAPEDLCLSEVMQRAEEVLNGELLTTNQVMALIGNPKPSSRQLREALSGLLKDGRAEREPKEEKRGATYRWRHA